MRKKKAQHAGLWSMTSAVETICGEEKLVMRTFRKREKEEDEKSFSFESFSFQKLSVLKTLS